MDFSSGDRKAAGSAKRPGVVDTPPELAYRLARGAISGLPRSGGTIREPIAILDPACGEGALLLACGELLHREGLAFSLFGIEIDEFRAEIAKKRLVSAFSATSVSISVKDALEVDWPGGTEVVANPPWVSFSGREAAPRAASGLQRHAARARAIGHWPSLHGAFLARIAEHVRTERTSGRVLLPASVAELEGYGPLREEVTRMTRLAGPPELLGEEAFPGVTMPAMLLALEPRPRKGRGSRAPWSLPGPRSEALLAPLREAPRLPPQSFSDPGVHSGNAARELVRDPEPGLPPLREGRDLAAFRLGPPRKALDVTLRPAPSRRFRYGSLEKYASVPILVRQTARRPIAALHSEPTYFRNSLLACTPPPGLAPELVVAVLNSSVAGAWHRLSFAEARQRTFPQVKVRHLQSLPFPFLARGENPALHDELVGAVRSLTRENLERRKVEIDQLVFEAFRIEPALRPRLRAAAGS